MTKKNDTLLARQDVPVEETWDLTPLYQTDQAWNSDLEKYEADATLLQAYKGTLSKGPKNLCALLEQLFELEQLGEGLQAYAFLKLSEDVGSSPNQARWARFVSAATRNNTKISFLRPEIMNIPENLINNWLQRKDLAPFQNFLHRWLRYRPHVLSEPEERLLTQQIESAAVASDTFNALTDVDMTFEEVKLPDGTVRTLTHGTYLGLLEHKNRSVRKKAYTQYYASFEAHKHTLAALYNGNVLRDIYQARVRKFPSSLEMKLFPDNVTPEVYHQLIQTVRGRLPDLHRYYDVRRRALKLKTLRLYDVYVPLVPDVKWHHTYEEAVERVLQALTVLGPGYTRTLEAGLLKERWVDRYENEGKRSGAFSSGSYKSAPYILMNYDEEVLNDVFTLAHEAGHSMHTRYSTLNQPFQNYNYTIFVAEVASTFNEQCLAQHLMSETTTDEQRLYLINKQITDLLGTLFRQTMFAEFEKITHAMAEQSEPLTLDSLTAVYEQLLRDYFGPGVELEEYSALEGLRIPHFYSSFYVYKYATGLAAAIALHEKVMKEGQPARNRYLDFLRAGSSKLPLDLLADAGVDMRSAEPVTLALDRFANLTDQLEAALL